MRGKNLQNTILHDSQERSLVAGARERAEGCHCFLKRKRPCPSGLVSQWLLAEGAEGAPTARYNNLTNSDRISAIKSEKLWDSWAHSQKNLGLTTETYG